MLGQMVLDEVSVPGLKGGSSYTITLERTVSGDVRGMALKFIVDALNTVEESDESNNVATLLIKTG